MPENKEYKVAVYCRFANEPQTALYCRTATKTIFGDLGIESQKTRLLRYAEENGYANPVLYIDNGEKGSTFDRPAMQRLVDDIEYGNVKTVIVTSTDRIARGITLLLEWLVFLKENKARCFSLEIDGKDIRNEFTFWQGFLRDFMPDVSKALSVY